jgi:hypothetical protein
MREVNMANRKRRTPPVPKQVIEPYRETIALLKKRLIDFDTASSDLEVQHTAWLTQCMMVAKPNAAYHIWLYGYASRLVRPGDTHFNETLSDQRMDSVLSFMQSIDDRAMSSAKFHRVGTTLSPGAATDDSADYRAVEVHLFIGSDPEPEIHRDVTPVKPKVMPLPGGQRFTDWSVAVVGGPTLSVGAGLGYNLVYIRNAKTQETRNYKQVIAVVGYSVGALEGAALAYAASKRLSHKGNI